MNLRERSLKRGVERPKRPLELAKRGLNLIFSRTYSLIYSMNRRLAFQSYGRASERPVLKVLILEDFSVNLRDAGDRGTA
jgi:hypothetical protein